jgi:hypothetical protein
LKPAAIHRVILPFKARGRRDERLSWPPARRCSRPLPPDFFTRLYSSWFRPRVRRCRKTLPRTLAIAANRTYVVHILKQPGQQRGFGA